MSQPVNCTPSELCTYLRALAEGFLPISYSVISQSAPSKSSHTASKFLRLGKRIVCFLGFPSSATFANSTAGRGAGLLTQSAEGYHVRTSAAREQEPASRASVADYGAKWLELSTRFDRHSSSWKTHRFLWDEDLPSSSVTLPRWGMMQDGALYQRETSGHRTGENGSFSWLTPLASQARRGWGVTLNVNPEASPRCGEKIRKNTLRDISEFGWKLNPFAHEWLMAWPHGWTDLKPLATDKFRQWLRSHGER
jgi:hypothetical protein